MSSQNGLAHTLTGEDFAKIRQLGNSRSYPKGSVIFSEGDEAGHIYFIESGRNGERRSPLGRRREDWKTFAPD